MFPWILCFLAAPSEPPASKTLPFDYDGTESVWWNPVESSSDVDGFKIFQGDILMSAEPNENLKNAIKSKKYLWEDGIIPYDFGGNFSCSEKNLIHDAMEVLQEKTCVKFVEKKDEETFIRFQKDKNGCYAPIGRLSGGDGPLPVNLQSPECFKEIGIIEHELLHVIGLFHEQSRPDRDEHVTIHWCNIEPFHEKDFIKGSDTIMNTFDLPYDFESIMHYPKWAFSRNGRPTITAKENPEMKLGQRKHPSLSDFEKVLKMYGCDARKKPN